MSISKHALTWTLLLVSLLGCRATTSSDVDVAKSQPEIRYYVIADT